MRTKFKSVTLVVAYAKLDIPDGAKLIEINNTTGNNMLVKIDNTGDILTVATGSVYQKKAEDGIKNDFYLSGNGAVTVEWEY